MRLKIKGNEKKHLDAVYGSCLIPTRAEKL
jgi:hypothetical protein